MADVGMRNEGVRVFLHDDYSTGMAKIAATTALANRELRDLDGTSNRAAPSLSRVASEANRVPPALDRTGSSAQRASSEIDTLSGRLSILAKVGLSAGPALIPIGALGAPAISAVSEAVGVAGLAVGTTMLAFSGLKDAITDLNDAQAKGTPEAFAKAKASLDAVSPSARDFVLVIDQAEESLDKLKMSAGSEMFPGLSAGLEDALTQLPRARALLQAVGGAVGDLGEMTGESLASGKWNEFLDFLTTEAPSAITDLGKSAGNLAGSMANLWMAFAPLNNDVLGGLVEATQYIEDWSAALDSTEGFQSFMQYIQDTGPQAGETLVALGNAGLQIVQAFAPLGGPTLRILETFADLVATIADSPLGTPLAAIATALSTLSLLNKGLVSTRGLLGGLSGAQAAGGGDAAGIGSFFQENADQVREAAGSMRSSLGQVAAVWGTAGARGERESGRLRAGLRGVSTSAREMGAGIARGGAPLAAMGLLATGTADSLGVQNTAMLAMTGSMIGPWGTAIGAGVGALLDLKAAGDGATSSMQGLGQAVATGDYSAITGQVDLAKKQMADLDDVTGVGDFFGDLGGRMSMNLGGGPEKWRSEIEGAKDAAAAVKEHERATSMAGMASDNLAQFMDQTARAALSEAGGLAAATEAMKDQRSAAIAALNAQLGYKGAVLDARDALKENGRTVDSNTRAGQANLGTLYNLASAWNAQDETVKGAQGALRGARSNFVTTAAAMGMAEDKARALARRLFEIPEKRAIDIALQDAASAKLQSIKAQIDGLRGKTLYINTVYTGRKPSAPGGFGAVPGSADGTTVPKTGRGYADRHLYLLADGEEVVSNRRGQADDFRPALKGINAGLSRLAVKALLADGGTTGDDADETDDDAKSEARTEKQRAGARKKAAARAKARSKARNAYADLDVDTSLHDGVSEAADRFADEVDHVRGLFKDAGLQLTKAQKHQLDGLRGSARELDRLTAAVKTTRDAQAAYSQQVAGSIDHDIFGNGLAGAQAQLDADTNDNNAMLTALAQAVSQGFDGAALQALAASGDLTTAQQLAAGGAGTIAGFEASYGNRVASQQSLGAYAGQQVYGAEVKTQTAAVLRMEKAIDRQTKEIGRLGGQVKDGARDGSQSGTKQGAAEVTLAKNQKSGQRSKTNRRGGRG